MAPFDIATTERPAVGPGAIRSGTLGHAPATRLSTLADAQAEFASVIARATANTGGSVGRDAGAAREAAADFVAAALVEPVLKQMRSGDRGGPPLAPGPGEKQFRGLLDAQVARRITRAANFPLVDHVARMLLGRAERAASVPGEEGAR